MKKPPLTGLDRNSVLLLSQTKPVRSEDNHGHWIGVCRSIFVTPYRGHVTALLRLQINQPLLDAFARSRFRVGGRGPLWRKNARRGATCGDASLQSPKTEHESLKRALKGRTSAPVGLAAS